MEAAHVQEMSPKPLVRRMEGWRERSAAVSWLWGGNLERGGIWKEEVGPAGMFWASPECPLPGFQAPLAQILASVSFWLVAEPAEHPGIDLGMASCTLGAGQVMAEKSQLGRLGPLRKDSTRSKYIATSGSLRKPHRGLAS